MEMNPSNPLQSEEPGIGTDSFYAQLIGSWSRRLMAMAREVTQHGQVHPYSWLITIVSLRSKEKNE